MSTFASNSDESICGSNNGPAESDSTSRPAIPDQARKRGVSGLSQPASVSAAKLAKHVIPDHVNCEGDDAPGPPPMSAGAPSSGTHAAALLPIISREDDETSILDALQEKYSTQSVSDVRIKITHPLVECTMTVEPGCSANANLHYSSIVLHEWWIRRMFSSNSKTIHLKTTSCECDFLRNLLHYLHTGRKLTCSELMAYMETSRQFVANHITTALFLAESIAALESMQEATELRTRAVTVRMPQSSLKKFIMNCISLKISKFSIKTIGSESGYINGLIDYLYAEKLNWEADFPLDGVSKKNFTRSEKESRYLSLFKDIDQDERISAVSVIFEGITPTVSPEAETKFTLVDATSNKPETVKIHNLVLCLRTGNIPAELKSATTRIQRSIDGLQCTKKQLCLFINGLYFGSCATRKTLNRVEWPLFLELCHSFRIQEPMALFLPNLSAETPDGLRKIVDFYEISKNDDHLLPIIRDAERFLTTDAIRGLKTLQLFKILQHDSLNMRESKVYHCVKTFSGMTPCADEDPDFRPANLRIRHLLKVVRVGVMTLEDLDSLVVDSDMPAALFKLIYRVARRKDPAGEAHAISHDYFIKPMTGRNLTLAEPSANHNINVL